MALEETLVIRINTSLLVFLKTIVSTHDLCGPYNKLQSVDRKQFPILEEAHHQHSQQTSMAL